MKKLNLIVSFLLFLNSCGIKPKPTLDKVQNNEYEIIDIGTIDLNKKGVRLKIEPLWYDNESKLHLVYGVTEENKNSDFITELHINFGGNIDCKNKSISAIFDFNYSPQLLLSDSINNIKPALKNIIQRKQEFSSVEFNYKNNSPGILVFAIEKINLKPNNKQNKVYLNIKSECSEYLNLPLILSKYNVSEVDELINNYINNELNQLLESELINLKVIFSYNQTKIREQFIIDMVDQRNMKILYYDMESKEYVLTDFEKNIIKKIKRNS